MSGAHTHSDLQAQLDALDARVTALETAGPVPPEPEPSDQRVIITIGGQEFVYDPADGADLGDFHDAMGPLVGLGSRFSMSCIRVSRPDCPIRVDFRSVVGWWAAIFDLGDAFAATAAPANLGAMSVQIGGETIELANHPWGSRWIWRSGPWPYDLIPIEVLTRHKLLLGFDPDIPCGSGNSGKTAVYTPLAWASCGLQAYMPGTGGRDDIGWLTDMCAQYVCGATTAAGVLAQGDAGGSPPWRLYDAERGRTLDPFEFPNPAFEGGNPRVIAGVNGDNASGISIDSAHQPAVSYLPYLLTGDPYYLENLHSQCVFGWVEYGRGGIYQYGPGIIQVRSYAWNLRSIVAAHAVTPENAPSWLLSKQAIATQFDWCVAGMRKMIAEPPQVSCSAFHDVSPNTWASKATWQMDFVLHGSAHAALLNPEWVPIAEWHAYNAISRLNGTSGWGRNMCDPYQFQIGIPHDTNATSFYKSWDEAWTGNFGALAKTDLDMAKPPDGQADYINGLRSGLAALSQAPLSASVQAEIAACLAYLTPYRDSWCRAGYRCESKWACRWEVEAA